MVVVGHGTQILWRGGGKRIGGEQGQDFWRALQQAHAKVHEPGVLPVSAERRKPHLPVKPGLMRRDQWRSPLQISGFVFEFVREPVGSVVAALNLNFSPRSCHHGEQSIGVYAAKGALPNLQRRHRPAPVTAQPKHRQDLREGNENDRNGDGSNDPTRPCAVTVCGRDYRRNGNGDFLQRVRETALTPALSSGALHYPHLFMKFNHLVLVLQQLMYSMAGCLKRMHPLIVRRPLNPLTGRSTNSLTRNCPINACSRACT